MTLHPVGRPGAKTEVVRGEHCCLQAALGPKPATSVLPWVPTGPPQSSDLPAPTATLASSSKQITLTNPYAVTCLDFHGRLYIVGVLAPQDILQIWGIVLGGHHN